MEEEVEEMVFGLGKIFSGSSLPYRWLYLATEFYAKDSRLEMRVCVEYRPSGKPLVLYREVL